MIYVVNAFSLNMLPSNLETFLIKGRRLTIKEATNLLEKNSFISYVGHADIANVISNQLGKEIVYNRQTLTITKGDSVLVCQYRGPRLPEGATTLPQGAVIEYYLVEIE